MEGCWWENPTNQEIKGMFYTKGVRPWFLNDYGTLLFERDHREVHGL